MVQLWGLLSHTLSLTTKNSSTFFGFKLSLLCSKNLYLKLINISEQLEVQRSKPLCSNNQWNDQRWKDEHTWDDYTKFVFFLQSGMDLWSVLRGVCRRSWPQVLVEQAEVMERWAVARRYWAVCCAVSQRHVTLQWGRPEGLQQQRMDVWHHPPWRVQAYFLFQQWQINRISFGVNSLIMNCSQPAAQTFLLFLLLLPFILLSFPLLFNFFSFSNLSSSYLSAWNSVECWHNVFPQLPILQGGAKLKSGNITINWVFPDRIYSTSCLQSLSTSRQSFNLHPCCSWI